ncbi:MAG: glycosyltransferase family 2 protein [Gemmataceae bacterium]
MNSLNGSAPQVWIVMPAYHEESRIGQTLSTLRPYLSQTVVVDDGSKDRTAEIALSRGVWVLRHFINRGQGAALQTGIDFALKQGADIIVTFDSDGQHDASEIGRMCEPILSGRADVALGSRFLGETVGMPFSRRVILKLGIVFTWLVSRIHVSDTHNGFRALSRSSAQKIRLHQDRMAHASEILDEIYRHGLRYEEVPVTIRYNEATLAKGQSSWNAAKIAWHFLIGKVVR